MRVTDSLTAGLAVLMILAGPALADGRGKGHDKGRGAHRAPSVSWSCPPGLAKKNPPCLPPGQARKGLPVLHVGDVLTDEGYTRLPYPDRYGLDVDPGWRYVRDGDTVYRVDRDTGRILAILNLLRAF